jgi:membrane protein implicated in regulation of membrane protease activity
MLVYGFFALVIVGLAWLTGGSVGKAAIVAGVVWVAAVVWSVARWRQRLQREEAKRRLAEEEAQ